MRRVGAVAVIAAGVAGVSVLGAGLSAWAGWVVPGNAPVITAKAARMPEMAKPSASVALVGTRISWKAVRFEQGQPVGGYVVTRLIDGKPPVTACTGAAGAVSCVDRDLATIVTARRYTVHAVAGTRWTGPASDPLKVPGVPPAKKDTATVSEPDLAGKGKKKTESAVTVPEPALTPAPTPTKALPTTSSPAPTQTRETTEAVTSPATVTPSEEPTP
ncbi:hypothetical protein [Actinoplanes rectilineatus]|uniref:hypothetical protein n=1 Tax=Actinoplanes rectilineatus TaxID=113571 RepID=UPI0005F295F0|nr:hypothetical protein [Actinoplanes rectilineatus]